MSVRMGSVLFADVVGAMEISNNLSIVEYDRFLEELQLIAWDVARRALPAQAEPGRIYELSPRGDEVCVIMHSGPELGSSLLENEDDAHSLGVSDIRSLLLFGIALKLRWLIARYNRNRVQNGQLPRDIAVGIHRGAVVHRKHPLGPDHPTSEGYSINLAKRIETASRDGRYTHIYVSQEVRYLAGVGTMDVGFGPSQDCSAKGYAQQLVAHEIDRVGARLFDTEVDVFADLRRMVAEQDLERYYRMAVVWQHQFWLRRLVRYLMVLQERLDLVADLYDPHPPHGDVDDVQSARDKAAAELDLLLDGANALFYAGDPGAALGEYARALEVVPDDPVVWLNVGNANLELQRYEDAVGAYQRTCELAPTVYRAWNNLGNALLRLRRTAEAGSAFHQAAELSPDDPRVWNNLGLVHMEREDWAEATKAFLRAVFLDGAYAGAHYNLACSLALAGRQEEAREALARATDLQPDLAERAQVDRDLAILRQ